MADLRDALQDAIAAGVRVPTTIEGIARLFGDKRGAQNRAIADALGVHIRTVQRWRTTTAKERRRPRPAMLERLRALARQRAINKQIDKMRGRGANVDFVGYVIYSGRRHDERRRHVTDLEIDEDPFGDVLDAAAAGDWDDAADRFEWAFLESWGVNPSTFSIGDVDTLIVRSI